MRVAMFGGSFDPMHNGHIALAKHFADLLQLDRVYVVPAKVPPHKNAKRTPGELRLEMCRLAAEGDSRLIVSDTELRRDGVSYTYYTVTGLMEENPGCEFFLITGADMFMTLDTWHRFGELSQLVTYCSVPRDDIDADMLRRQAAVLESMGCRTLIAQTEPVDISSTMVRRRAAEGLPLNGLVPPAVERFITEHGLYRGDSD